MVNGFDVLAIGNAIVDILARTDEAFLVEIGVSKGMMRLIDAAEADRLYARMGPAVEASGGSAGNTAAGVASFGGRAAYVGKVADDDFGRIFRHDIRAQGVHFETRPLVGGAPTARSMILITPDGERTMNTYLGACTALGEADIDPEVVAAMVGAKEPSVLDVLTGRERDVLGLMSEVLDNQAIAADLVIAEKSVQKHINTIFAKLHLGEETGTHRRVRAVLLWLTAQSQSAPITPPIRGSNPGFAPPGDARTAK